MSKCLEHMTVDEVGEWLQSHGFRDEVVAAFEENDMDGDALALAFAAHSGPDCLKDVVSKYGFRLKVYQAIKAELEANRTQNNSDLDNSGVGEDSNIPITPSSSLQITEKTHSAVSETSTPSRTSSTRIQTTPNPFPIPMFRVDTEDNLKGKRLGDDDRKYIIRVLATVLCTYVQRPSMRDCEVVAKSLVAKYTFLKEHQSWKQFLYTKCQNLNRKAVKTSSDSDTPAKRRKMDKSHHEYPSCVVEIEDDTSHQRNLDALMQEVSKPNSRSDVLKDLMKRTYGRRRRWILEEERLVSTICAEYPPLKKAPYVMQEFDLVMDKDDLFTLFGCSWPKWEKAILEYGTGTKNKTQGLTLALRDLKDTSDTDVDDAETVSNGTITALRCLAYFLCKKEKSKTRQSADLAGTSKKPHIPYILQEVPRGTPDKEAIDSGNNYPHIVMYVDADLDLPPRYRITVEQKFLLECRSLLQAIFCLLAVHYVFNIQYHSRTEDFYLFLLEKVLGVKEPTTHKKSPSYLASTSAIECYLDSD